MSKLAAVLGILAAIGVDLSKGDEIQMPKEPVFDDYPQRDFYARPSRRDNGHPLNPRGQK